MADEEILRGLRSIGLRALEPVSSAALLLDAISLDQAHVVVADVEWDRFISCMEARRRQPLFDRLRRIAGKHDLSARPGTRADLAERMQRTIGQVLGIPLAELNERSNLMQLGLDSLTAIELRDRLATVGVAVPLRLLLGDMPIAELVEQVFAQHTGHKAAQSSATPTPMRTSASKWLIVPKPRSSARVRLVCLAYAGGGPAVYSRWPAALGEDIELIVAQLPGRGSRLDEPPMAHLADMVAGLATDFAKFVRAPYVVFGHCLGALLGHEVVLSLRERGFPLPSHFFASGARAPRFYNPEQLAIDVLQYSPLDGTPGHELPDELLLEMLRDLNFDPSEAIFRDKEIRDTLLPSVRADLAANNLYTWREREPLDVPAMVFGGRVDPYVNAGQVLGWRAHFSGPFESLFVPGDHFFIERQRDTLLAAVSTRLASLGS
jgi:surfactin synthase thioesterase subunit/aryl carrier-like protein